ncbi:MAG: DMT family transporter, partial [Chloroflexota bacterium]|nr:DMT family transporter [Chloroflexota bacterium]
PRRHRPLMRLPVRDLLGFALLGGLFVTNSLFYYLSLSLLPVGTASVLVFVFPALVVLWSRLFQKEDLSALRVLALILALIGVVFTVDPVAALALGAGISWLGVGWALGSALSNSWYVTLAGVVGQGRPPLSVALYSLPVTAICFGVYLAFTGGFPREMATIAWASCVGIGVLTGAAVYLYLIGVGRIGASRAAIVATSEPATAVLLGALLLGESITAFKLLGGGFVVAAIALLSLARSGQIATPAAQQSPASPEPTT